MFFIGRARAKESLGERRKQIVEGFTDSTRVAVCWGSRKDRRKGKQELIKRPRGVGYLPHKLGVCTSGAAERIGGKSRRSGKGKLCTGPTKVRPEMKSVEFHHNRRLGARKAEKKICSREATRIRTVTRGRTQGKGKV